MGALGYLISTRRANRLGSLQQFGSIDNLIPTLFCRDLDDRVSALQQALKIASDSGVTGDSVDQAQAYVDKQTSVFSRDVVLTGDACKAQVSYAQTLLDALNASLTIAGQPPVPVAAASAGGSGDVVPVSGVGGSLIPGWVPWVAGGIGVVVVLGVVGYFVRSLK
jgi:hypothetical protein